MNVFIGVDPGVTDTGVVIKTEQSNLPMRYAVFNSKGAKYAGKFNITERVDTLAREVAEWAYAQMFTLSGEETHYLPTTLTIETPIYNANARGFQIQWRLYQQIISNFCDMGLADKLVEVNPGTIKKSHTGDGKASKLDMICSGHFDGPDYGSTEEQEALADAEAICDCGKNPLLGERTDMLVEKDAAHIGPTFSS
jgi:Holliday junction resolvasome RuvABC endonuclease subunit